MASVEPLKLLVGDKRTVRIVTDPEQIRAVVGENLIVTTTTTVVMVTVLPARVSFNGLVAAVFYDADKASVKLDVAGFTAQAAVPTVDDLSRATIEVAMQVADQLQAEGVVVDDRPEESR